MNTANDPRLLVSDFGESPRSRPGANSPRHPAPRFCLAAGTMTTLVLTCTRLISVRASGRVSQTDTSRGEQINMARAPYTRKQPIRTARRCRRILTDTCNTTPVGNDYLLFKGQVELGPNVKATPIPHLFNLNSLTWRRGPRHRRGDPGSTSRYTRLRYEAQLA